MQNHYIVVYNTYMYILREKFAIFLISHTTYIYSIHTGVYIFKILLKHNLLFQLPINIDFALQHFKLFTLALSFSCPL